MELNANNLRYLKLAGTCTRMQSVLCFCRLYAKCIHTLVLSCWRGGCRCSCCYWRTKPGSEVELGFVSWLFFFLIPLLNMAAIGLWFHLIWSFPFCRSCLNQDTRESFNLLLLTFLSSIWFSISSERVPDHLRKGRKCRVKTSTQLSNVYNADPFVKKEKSLFQEA